MWSCHGMNKSILTSLVTIHLRKRSCSKTLGMTQTKKNCAWYVSNCYRNKYCMVACVFAQRLHLTERYYCLKFVQKKYWNPVWMLVPSFSSRVEFFFLFLLKMCYSYHSNETQQTCQKNIRSTCTLYDVNEQRARKSL